MKVDLVEVEHPERMVDVTVPATHRRDAVMMTLTVPERFYPVPRCRDRAECKEREYLAEGVAAAAMHGADPIRTPEPVEDDDPSAYL